MVKPEREERNTVWLELPDYHVVTLNVRFAEHVIELERTIHQGISAYRDLTRQDFFEVALGNGWVYIHVYADAHAVYLIAYSVSRFFSSVSHENSFENEPERLNEEMQKHESTGFKLDGEVRFETRGSPSPNWPEMGQIDLFAITLSRALHDEPNFTYLIPDERERRELLPWFFRSLAIRASQFCGEIYTTDNIDGAALWIGPGCACTIDQTLRTGMLRSLLRLGWASVRRCLTLSTRLEEVHRRLARGPHWYLMVLGVEPPDRRQVIGGVLIDPVLSRADSDALPCYLETFNPANLPFYKKRGFRIVGGGNIPRGGPDFWAMMRAPQTKRMK